MNLSGIATNSLRFIVLTCRAANPSKMPAETNNEADLKRYRALFDKLDVDKDGLVNITELKKFFSERHIVHTRGQADVSVTSGDVAVLVYF